MQNELSAVEKRFHAWQRDSCSQTIQTQQLECKIKGLFEQLQVTSHSFKKAFWQRETPPKLVNGAHENENYHTEKLQRRIAAIEAAVGVRKTSF